MSNSKPFYTIKFIPYRKNLGDIMCRQSKDNKCFSHDGRYKFYINEDIKNPDFVVVQSKGLRHKSIYTVSPQNTILLTTEPESILTYPHKYYQQFGVVCSCQKKIKHSNLVLAPPILPWFVGYTETKEGKCSYTLDYNILKQKETTRKTKLISVITSNKAFTKGHLDRIKFVEKLKDRFGNQIDIFGRGYNTFDDKWDVLAPYKYHIVIENSSQEYYWTEKLSDCFLAETFPIYYGCTNLDLYFSNKSYKPINILNPTESFNIIDNILKSNTYEDNIESLKIAKNQILDEYNFFNYIASLCDKLNPLEPKTSFTIKPCKTMKNWHNFFNYTIGRNFYKSQYELKKRICRKHL